MVDQSSRFIEGGFMSFEPTAEAVSHDPSAFPSCANEFSIGPNINSPHYCPAPTVALRPPISQENPTHNCSTTPIIEFPESDPIDPNSFVHSPPEAYFCNNENISNVNVNFELNEANLNTMANVVHHDVDVNEQVVNSIANVVHHNVLVNHGILNSAARVDNHIVDVQQQVLQTQAIVNHHNIEVKENTLNSVANVESNLIEVKSNTIKSIANVDNHELEVKTNTIKTITEVDNHKLDIRNNTIESIANVDNHEIKVNKNDIISAVNVDNHKVLVKKHDYSSIADVECHFLDIQKNNIKSIANIDNHYIDIHKNDNRSIANVDNHYVDVISNDQRSIARVDNHLVDVQERTHNSTALVQHHEVNVLNELCSSTALVQSNQINVNEMTLTNTANIYSNNIKVNHQIIPSTAEVQNHKVNIVEKTLQSTIAVPKFVVNVTEKEVPINISTENIANQLLCSILQATNQITNKNLTPVSIDKSSIGIQSILDNEECHEIIAASRPHGRPSKKSIPYSSMNATKPYSSRCSTIDDGENQRPAQAVTDVSDIDEGERSEVASTTTESSNSSQSVPNSNRNINDNQLRGHNNRDNDRRDNSPSDASSGAEEDEGNFTPESLERDLREVSSYEDLKRVRRKWNHKLVDASLWGSNVDVVENPVMWNVVISSEWPGVGRFICPHCLTHADDVHANIRNHLEREHGTVPIDTLHNATIAKIIGRSHLWKLCREDNEDVIIESVYTCTEVGCNYFTNVRKNYLSHIRSHAQLKDLVQKFGAFWGPIIDRAKTGKMLKAADIFRERMGFGCPFCDDYIACSENNFSAHISQKHSNVRIEGVERPTPTRIRLIPMITHESNDIDEIAPGLDFVRLSRHREPRVNRRANDNNQQQHENEPSTENTQIPQITRNIDHNTQDERLNSSVSSSQPTQQSQTQIINEHRQEDPADVLGLNFDNNTSHNSVNIINANLPSDSDDDDGTHSLRSESIMDTLTPDEMAVEEVEEEIHYDKEELLRKAVKWLRKCEEEEENGVSLPRLKARQRKRVIVPIRNLFETKITELIKFIKFRDMDDDDWTIAEGILARISLLIRKCIRTSLKIPINNTKKKKVRNRDLEYNRSTLTVKRIFQLTELSDLLEKLSEISDTRETAANRNSIANIERRIVDCIQQTDAGVVNELFGGRSIENVRRFLNDSEEHRDSKLKWLHGCIIKEERNYEVLRGHRHEKTIQEFYREDARRCAEWFIYGTVSPECKVPLENFVNHFRNEWRRSGDYKQDSPLLNLDPSIDEETQHWMLKKLSDLDSIGKVIRSKANMSAAGPDAISNVVWKSNVNVTCKLVSRLMKAMLASGKSPSAWKRSRTIMLYKKGDSDNVKSWRPISLTPTLYRIVMGHVANVVQDANKRNPIFSCAQKGFVANVNGCSEHIGVLNELFSHATRNKKDINVVTLDFANAFGSVDHRQIVNSLVSLGFPKPFCRWIKDLYNENVTTISVNGENSQMIPMERGVRQGCPFSPILFNLCLEPLLRELLSNHKADGYRIDDLSFNVQAFADDVVLISHNTEQMRSMLRTVQSFCSVTGMKLTGSKCKWLSYMMKDGRRVSSSDTLEINEDEIKSINISDCIKYLGAPIATNRTSKMKFSENLLIKVRHQINQLLLSPLTLSQSLDAIRRLIIPQLDFIFMNGVLSLSFVKKLDENIRGLIQKKIKCPGLPIEVVHSDWKNGGMNIPRLEHRLELLQIRSFLGLVTSKDERIRNLIKHNIIDEAHKRHFLRSDDNSFIGFNKTSLGSTNALKTNTTFTRALQAADKLNISIKVEDEGQNDPESLDWISDSPLTIFKLTTAVDNDGKIINAKSFLPTMNLLLDEQYSSDLSSKEFRCHSFDSLKNSKLSNFFIGNCNAPTSDCLVKFAFQARTNSLLTEEVEHKRNLNPSDKCRACGDRFTGSLMHRLNKCNASMVRITARHNAIARVISDGLKDMLGFNCPPLNENSTVFIRDEEILPERSRNMKPDIWFIEEDVHTHKRTINIIEITCPYGMQTDTAQGRRSSLEIREEEKVNKYSKLIDDIKDTWSIDSNLYVIVVSSLGAITKNTVKTLKKLFITKERSKLIAKRCVIAAIRGSWAIFNGRDIRNSTNNRNNNASDDTDHISSNDLIDEEDGDILNNDN